MEVDGDVGPGQPVAEDMDLAVGVADSQSALTDETLKQIGQQTHVAVPLGAANIRSNVSARGHAVPDEAALISRTRTLYHEGLFRVLAV